ncbi:hypothetical protein B0H17DRAFT_1177049 [Mycena rosella]|uniref:Uncharacterized protein n=1 Tax=Mycena rosella TaxID=1033263 RepID=A0AAD7DWN7_MYCRO|nr:hypothetical protein B0H17DRAFT_1177049 [Mycena rosella]
MSVLIANLNTMWWRSQLKCTQSSEMLQVLRQLNLDMSYWVFSNFVAAGVAETAMLTKVHLYSKIQAATGCFERFQPISSTQSVASLACDLVITAVLCTVLRKSRTGIRSLWALLQLIFVLQPCLHVRSALSILFQFVAMLGTFVFICHLSV